MTTAPVLGYPKGSEPFILDSDASDRAILAELSQLQDGKYRVIDNRVTLSRVTH